MIAGRRGLLLVVSVALALAIPATTALAAEGELTFFECIEDTGAPSGCSDRLGTVDGLATLRSAAISPDGAHVYAVSSGDDAVAAFSRNQTNGALDFVGCVADTGSSSGCDTEGNTVDGLNFAVGVAVSPDGSHVYVSSRDDDAVATFSRDQATGALDFVGCVADTGSPSTCDTEGGTVDGLDAAAGLAVSGDGRHLYAVSSLEDAVAAFSRDQATGALGFVDVINSGGGVSGLQGAVAVTVSPDDLHVYVGSDSENSGVAAFSRDQATGALGFVDAELDGVGGVDGVDGASGLAVSPDGRHLYVSASADNAVAFFARNATSGGLAYLGCVGDGDGASTCPSLGGAITTLNSASDVEVSADGKHVYVTASVDDALTAFTRSPLGGGLSPLDAHRDGVAGVDGLDGARTLALPAGGSHLYVGSTVDSALATFTRERDTTPPETTIDSAPSGSSGDRNPTVSFSSSDPAFTSGFECSLDGAAFSACVSPLPLGPLADGDHSFAVRARDTAGNLDPTPARRTFTVVSAPPVATPSAPVEGETINTIPKRGKVRVNTPGPGGFRPLVEGELLPVGTKVDARRGRVVLVSDYNGRLQRMTFWDGRFLFDQERGRRPIVEVALIGKLSCPGRRGRGGTAPRLAGIAGAAGAGNIARKKKRKGRRLWGKGKRGRYKSKGKRGSATVRGTKWRTEDRCNGSTRFTLKRGKIVIDDFGKPGKRNAVLRGKGRYTARR